MKYPTNKRSASLTGFTVKPCFFFLLLIFTFHLLTFNCFSQWVIQNSGTTEHLYDVSFINAQTGWACGNNGIMIKTNDGGNNWVTQNSGLTFPIYSVHFTSENIGYAVTRVDGYFIKTTNGGVNWNLVYFSPKSFESIFFIDSLRGWATGISGTGWIFKTTTGGAIWDSINLVGTGQGNCIQFINSNTGWAAMGFSLFKSTDSGINWTEQYFTGGGEIQSVSFLNANTGYFVTLESWSVYKTTNSGNNWTFLIDLPDFFNSHCIFFKNINTGYVSGDGGNMYSTLNGGLNWQQQQTNTTSFLQSVQFITDSIGWAVGGGGRIINTNTAGKIVAINNISNEMPNKFILEQNYPNPFNPSTKIKFQISKLSAAKIIVFDILGREIAILVNEQLKPGTYETEFNGTNLASGLYFYKIEAGQYVETKKMLLIK